MWMKWRRKRWGKVERDKAKGGKGNKGDQKGEENEMETAYMNERGWNKQTNSKEEKKVK